MTTFVRRLLLAGLTLILIGGVTTPAVAQDADTDPTGSATTDPSSETTDYTFSSVEAPYNLITDAYGVTSKVPWYPQLDSQTFTRDDILDDSVANEPGAKFESSFTESTSDSLSPVNMFSLANEGLHVTAKDTFASYIYARTAKANPQFTITSEDFPKMLIALDYGYTWLFKVAAQMNLYHRSFSSIKSEYDTTIKPKLAAMSSLVEQGISGMISDESTFKATISSSVPALISSLHLDSYKDQLNTLDPDASAQKEADLLAQTMSNFCKEEKTGYLADGQLSTGTFPTAFAFERKATAPTATSQPVTIHYVDEQGKTLQPDKTLTGSLGATYQTDPATIADYQLVKTTGQTTGTFTSSAQDVTYTYRYVAFKNRIVYATQKIGLYASPTFTKANRFTWYAKKSRLNRPTFRVIGTAKSQTGVTRYKVRDLNGAGTTGYITANSAAVAPLYYATKHAGITVINPAGLNAYTNAALTGKATHYAQGQTLKVTGIVHHNLTTRFVLSDGRYISANKRLVTTENVTQPQRVKAKTAVNRYDTANLTQRNKHYPKAAHATFKVTGWAYSNAHNYRKGDTLRYRVAGGYITANPKYVTPVK